MSQITSPQYRKAFILVTTLFFMWGLSYGLIDVLNKHFQVTLNVSKAQSGLIQAAYFGAYFVVAIPAGLFMEWKASTFQKRHGFIGQVQFRQRGVDLLPVFCPAEQIVNGHLIKVCQCDKVAVIDFLISVFFIFIAG